MLWNFMLTLLHTFDALFFDPDTFDQYELSAYFDLFIWTSSVLFIQ